MERFRDVRKIRFISALGITVTLYSQFVLVPYQNYIPVPSHANISLIFSKSILSNKSRVTDADVVNSKWNHASDSGWGGDPVFLRKGGRQQGESEVGEHAGFYLEKENQLPSEFTSSTSRGLAYDKIVKMRDVNKSESNPLPEDLETGVESMEHVEELKSNLTENLALSGSGNAMDERIRSIDSSLLPVPSVIGLESVANASDTSILYIAIEVSTRQTHKNDLKLGSSKGGGGLLQTSETTSVSSKDNSGMIAKPSMKKIKRRPTSISDMANLLRFGSSSATLLRPQWFSARDEELLNARRHIESAPLISNAPRSYASLFRNYSMFVRSYELMERVLRVYVYKEGDNPIFHQPRLRGIYASEGWFMKLMEGNKRFVVRDARKAHLFYLPFSSLRLRRELDQQNFTSYQDLEKHLESYVHIIASKYHFWNRTNGADHFLVACHDWGTYFTNRSSRSCIRALCHSNVARGFEIGKDVSLPMTNILSAENPVKYLGGNQPSGRPTLAFFAGAMHGYLRPVLLQHWSNKEPDMKIFGSMARDSDGKRRYREFMKSSRYCICARGTSVHSPRVIESIYYECVPVIIADNYMPPFFEIFDWETFAVFVLEKDVPKLRNILLSIPEKRYTEMQKRLKLVQRHFLWHKVPIKYDLFHMILHSIWYKRVFQVKS